MTSNNTAKSYPPRVAMVGRFLQQVIISLWWGGLTFYSAVVVHIGTQVLGSERQGFVTQRVTYVLNGLGLLAVIIVWNQVRNSRQVLPWVIWSLLGLSQLGLFVDHYRLSGMLDFETQTVPDPKIFYAEHAVYLWLTAVQWTAGLGWLAWTSFQDRHD